MLADTKEWNSNCQTSFLIQGDNDAIGYAAGINRMVPSYRWDLAHFSCTNIVFPAH